VGGSSVIINLKVLIQKSIPGRSPEWYKRISVSKAQEDLLNKLFATGKKGQKVVVSIEFSTRFLNDAMRNEMKSFGAFNKNATKFASSLSKILGKGYQVEIKHDLTPLLPHDHIVTLFEVTRLTN